MLSGVNVTGNVFTITAKTCVQFGCFLKSFSIKRKARDKVVLEMCVQVSPLKNDLVNFW